MENFIKKLIGLPALQCEILVEVVDFTSSESGAGSERAVICTALVVTSVKVARSVDLKSARSAFLL